MRSFFFFTLLLIVACNQPETVTEKKYFSLEKYFHEQADSLQINHIKIKKTITKNDENEIHQYDTVTWNNELKPFLSCDINKPAWINSYKVDSIYTGDVGRIIYTSKEKNLPILTIEINTLNNNIEKITITKNKINLYYSSFEKYIYDPHYGYAIEGRQKIRFRDEIRYVISSQFLN